MVECAEYLQQEPVPCRWCHHQEGATTIRDKVDEHRFSLQDKAPPHRPRLRRLITIPRRFPRHDIRLKPSPGQQPQPMDLNINLHRNHRRQHQHLVPHNVPQQVSELDHII